MLMSLVVVLGEAAANDNHPIRGLDGERVNVAVRAVAEVDGWIHRAGGQQAGDAVAGDAIGLSEITGQNNPIIGLDRNGFHGAIGSKAHGADEIRVQRTIRVEARDAVYGRSVNAGEIAADKDASIGLDGNGPDVVVGPDVRAEIRIHRTVHIQTDEVADDHIVEVCDRTAD